MVGGEVSKGVSAGNAAMRWNSQRNYMRVIYVGWVRRIHRNAKQMTEKRRNVHESPTGKVLGWGLKSPQVCAFRIILKSVADLVHSLHNVSLSRSVSSPMAEFDTNRLHLFTDVCSRMSSERDEENRDPEDNNDYRLEMDAKVVDEWTRGTLFPKVKFLYDDKDLAAGGALHKFFIDTCRGTRMDVLSEEAGTAVRGKSPKSLYRDLLWKFCGPKIRKNLSVKRSGVTNQMGAKFMGK